MDLIERSLRIQLRFEWIDGSCSITERNRILDDFKKNSNTQILIIIITGTGVIGLNLAIANFVYIIEQQWNPIIENQAIARVVRLGQKKNVSVSDRFHPQS